MSTPAIFAEISFSPMTILLSLYAATLTGFSVWQLHTRESKQLLREQLTTSQNAAAAAETTRDAWESQLKLSREDRDKVREELQKSAKRIGELEARTNLDSLEKKMSEQHQEVLAVIKRENTEAQLILVQTIQSITKDIMKGFSEHAASDLERQSALTKELAGLRREVGAVTASA